ncbi:MAG: endonuclease, partial [Bacillota bacterium]
MKSAFMKILIILGALLALVLLLVIGYVVYMQLTYYRIADNTALTVENPQAEELARGVAYTAVTYNIGFGAYNHDFSFFMDNGTMLDGTPVSGTMSRAQSAEIAHTNTAGALAEAQGQDADFYLLQEVDTKSTRSFKINQQAAFVEGFSDFASAYAVNFHSAYLIYPFNEPHGKANSGLLTLSRYAIN